MTVLEAQEYIYQMRNASANVKREIMTNYYEKFSYALSPLVVIAISCAIGGRFKKNILLLSLIVSLCISVLHYVIQMIAVLMAKQGVLSPILGAWFSIIVFGVIALVLYRAAKT